MYYLQNNIVKKAIRHIKIIYTFVQFILNIINIKLNNYKSTNYEKQSKKKRQPKTKICK